jgi:hypothetical protein
MNLAYQIWIKEWVTVLDTIDVVDISTDIVLDDNIANPKLPLVIGEYYRIVFGSYEGRFRYNSFDNTGGTNEYTFKWNHMPLDFGSPVTAVIYNYSYNKTTVTDVDTSGGVEESVEIDDYFLSVKQQLNTDTVFRGDAYDIIIANYCDTTEFILFIRKRCADGWKEFRQTFKTSDMLFDTQTCVIVSKDAPNPEDIVGLLETEIDIITDTSTFYSIVNDVYTVKNATLPANAKIKFERLMWVNTIIEFIIAETRLPVQGFRSVLLNINNPADYTYTQVDTYADYGNYYYLMIAALGDMVKPSASNKATKLSVSLKGLMSNLCKMYNGLYFVDDDGYLRLEHWEYIDNVGSRLFDTENFTVKQYEQLDDINISAKTFTYKHHFPYQDPFATPGNPNYAHGVGTIDYNKHFIPPVASTKSVSTLIKRLLTYTPISNSSGGFIARQMKAFLGHKTKKTPPPKTIFTKGSKEITVFNEKADDVVIENVGTDGYALCLFNSATITTYTDNVWVPTKNDYFLCVVKGTASSGPDTGSAAVALNSYENDYLGWDYLLPQYHRHHQPNSETWYPPDSDLISTVATTWTAWPLIPPPTNPYIFTSQEYTANQLLLPLSLTPDSVFVALITNCCPPELGIMDYVLTDKGRARVIKITTDLGTGAAEIEAELRICP